MVCNTSCWRSVIMTLAALPGMARTSPSVGEIGGLGKYRKTRAIVEARFSQRVLGGQIDARFRGAFDHSASPQSLAQRIRPSGSTTTLRPLSVEAMTAYFVRSELGRASV